MHTVTAPNADTLYTTAWVDVSEGAMGLQHSHDMGDRYYLMPMLDGWTDVFQVPGKRTTGDKAQKCMPSPDRVGPGTLPAGVTEYKSPTGLVLRILGRIYCTGTPPPTMLRCTLPRISSPPRPPLSSCRNWQALLAAAGERVDSSFHDMKTAVRDQVDAMDVNAFFTYLAKLMKTKILQWRRMHRWWRGWPKIGPGSRAGLRPQQTGRIR